MAMALGQAGAKVAINYANNPGAPTRVRPVQGRRVQGFSFART